MFQGNLYTLTAILIIAIVTFIIRATPFIFFGNGKETPGYITYLGKYLPPSVIAMLIIYCLKKRKLNCISLWTSRICRNNFRSIASSLETKQSCKYHRWNGNLYANRIKDLI